MKKALVVIVALIAILVVSTCALAVTGPQLTVWQLNGAGSWVQLDSNGSPGSGLLQLARAWKSYANYEGLTQYGYCNKEAWDIDLVVNATVAQWIDWSICGTQFDWQVHKPGAYVASPVSLVVKSNEDVKIDFSGFTNLASVDNSGPHPITIYWTLNDQSNAPSNGDFADWKTVGQLNELDPIIIAYGTFDNSASTNQNAITKYLWHKIVVDEETRACEYRGTGKITVSVTDLKYFIDGPTGNWNGTVPQ
ncbi:MAG: hypothetical protein K6U80_09485 [Firmicutes bacterium]|nr:hypothetical protein [Bacillota bacterium]